MNRPAALKATSVVGAIAVGAVLYAGALMLHPLIGLVMTAVGLITLMWFALYRAFS